MAWVDISGSGTAVGDANGNYGDAWLQYDSSSTGSTRPVRLIFRLYSGRTIYIYFDNVTVGGQLVTSRQLVQGDTDFASVNCSPGYVSYSFSCPWYTGTRSFSGGGTLPSATTPPTGLSCTDVQRGQDSLSATVSVTGWGVGSGTKYRELQVWTNSASGLVEPRRYQPVNGDTKSSTITVNNSSSGGTLTLVPNTMYVLGIYASNGSANTGSQRVGQYSTLPPTTTISNTAVTTTSATFTYSVPNQGGQYDMALKYQLDSGSLVTVATLTGSGTKSGSFTVSGLTPGTTHTVTASLTTSAGEVVSNTVTFTTAQPPVKLYGSVSGKTKLVRKLYGSVNGQTKEIKKLYGSVNGKTKLIYEKGA